MDGNDVTMLVPASIVGRAYALSPNDPLGWLRARMEEALAAAEGKPPEPEPVTARGLRWGPLVLEPGTKLRADFRGETHVAEVNAEGDLLWQGKAMSPATFANRAAGGTTRNAWTFLLVRRPDDVDFMRADRLRESL
jgi:hypothetical protein